MSGETELLLACLIAQLRRGSIVLYEEELHEAARLTNRISVEAHPGAHGAVLYEFRLEKETETA